MELTCPACRRHTERGLELFTLEPASAELLRCRGCGKTYPVIDGIPVLLRDLSQADALGLFAPLHDPDALAALRSFLMRDGWRGGRTPAPPCARRRRRRTCSSSAATSWTRPSRRGSSVGSRR